VKSAAAEAAIKLSTALRKLAAPDEVSAGGVEGSSGTNAGLGTGPIACAHAAYTCSSTSPIAAAETPACAHLTTRPVAAAEAPTWARAYAGLRAHHRAASANRGSSSACESTATANRGSSSAGESTTTASAAHVRSADAAAAAVRSTAAAHLTKRRSRYGQRQRQRCRA